MHELNILVHILEKTAFEATRCSLYIPTGPAAFFIASWVIELSTSSCVNFRKAGGYSDTSIVSSSSWQFPLFSIFEKWFVQVSIIISWGKCGLPGCWVRKAFLCAASANLFASLSPGRWFTFPWLASCSFYIHSSKLQGCLVSFQSGPCEGFPALTSLLYSTLHQTMLAPS